MSHRSTNCHETVTCHKRVNCSDENSTKKDIKQLKEDNKLLTERVKKLEKLINDMISYQPDGDGYKETKEHFENISQINT